MLKTIDLSSVRGWNPCYDPQKYAPSPDWKGTIIDILKYEEIPHHDRVWCANRYMDNKQRRLFAVDCAKRAMSRVKEEYRDERSLKCLEVAERFANGQATDQERVEAREQAYSAWRDANSRWHRIYDEVWNRVYRESGSMSAAAAAAAVADAADAADAAADAAAAAAAVADAADAAADAAAADADAAAVDDAAYWNRYSEVRQKARLEERQAQIDFLVSMFSTENQGIACPVQNSVENHSEVL